MNLRSGGGLRAHGRAAAEPSGPKEARGREPANGEEVPRDREAGDGLWTKSKCKFLRNCILDIDYNYTRW